ncbi:MAG: hypothetical protein Q7U30_14325 [Methylicorpusculum sp.]|nr:hypothetical protein [Methylicorpusculum sp.]
MMIKRGSLSFAGLTAAGMLPSSPHEWIYGVPRKAYADPQRYKKIKPGMAQGGCSLTPAQYIQVK